jgi:hypothetical protein
MNNNSLLVITLTIVIVSGLVGILTIIPDSYATIALKQSQQPLENSTARPERQFQQQPSEAHGATPEGQQSRQPSEASGATTIQPERQSQQQPSEASEDDTESERQEQAADELSNAAEQQEDGNNEELKDEQQEQDEDNNGNGEDDNEEQVNIDKAPVAITGNNIYVAWWTNETGNDEVMFRASTDAGQTFRDQINLSNTTDADSTRVEIDSDADSIVVTWWETNQTSDTPFMKVSNDNGETFGPLLELATSGTIGAAEE